MSPPDAMRRASSGSEPKPEHIPDPTYWPVVVALGSSVAAMGLATMWLVTAVGTAVTAIGLIRWIGAMTSHD